MQVPVQDVVLALLYPRQSKDPKVSDFISDLRDSQRRQAKWEAIVQRHEAAQAMAASASSSSSSSGLTKPSPKAEEKGFFETITSWWK